ncbi:hypothetical protein HDV00_004610 [Rhizophlyctis rosea]|nr:hypothetical protein HDV00_004610 [Rhizophlyctis rosea]
MSRNHKPKGADSALLKALSSNSVNSVGNYVFGKTLGEGTFGKVKLAVHRLTGQEVAIKIVDKIHAPSVIREIETWRHLHHPNIAQLYEVLTTESRIYMVMEHCAGGEAFDYVCERGRLNDRGEDARRIFRQVVEAVGYCHEKNFVHRDLKLENILLTTDLNVKVIDFGFTRSISTPNLLDTYCGSVAYAAPEMISGQKYHGPQADIWSLGVILYTMICGYLPFDDDNDLTVHRKILNLEYDLPDFLSDVSKDIITKILQKDGSHRLTIPQILTHPWFRDDTLNKSPPPSVHAKPLGSTPEESALISKLEALGMDVEGILASVQGNACDQASALWYLLLQKERGTPQSSEGRFLEGGGVGAGEWVATTGGSPGASGSPVVGSPAESGVLRPVDVEKYLAAARRKSNAGIEGGGTVGVAVGVAGGVGGYGGGSRRGLIMEAMKGGAGGGGGGGGGGRSRSGGLRVPSAPARGRKAGGRGGIVEESEPEEEAGSPGPFGTFRTGGGSSFGNSSAEGTSVEVSPVSSGPPSRSETPPILPPKVTRPVGVTEESPTTTSSPPPEPSTQRRTNPRQPTLSTTSYTRNRYSLSLKAASGFTGLKGSKSAGVGGGAEGGVGQFREGDGESGRGGEVVDRLQARMRALGMEEGDEDEEEEEKEGKINGGGGGGGAEANNTTSVEKKVDIPHTNGVPPSIPTQSVPVPIPRSVVETAEKARIGTGSLSSSLGAGSAVGDGGGGAAVPKVMSTGSPKDGPGSPEVGRRGGAVVGV